MNNNLPYPVQSIRLILESSGISVPIMCLQCDNAACEKVCPVGAITRNEETGAMVINQMKCIKCKMCINACPFGCTGYDSLTVQSSNAIFAAGTRSVLKTARQEP
jgi:Fe-S-cluster-containing hydrogenase component 2